MRQVRSEMEDGGLAGLTAEAGLAALRAIAEPTRLRILVLLGGGELTVKDLTTILGQSQPRISRHLKLMHEAGLLTRVQEGSWVYFRLADDTAVAHLASGVSASFAPSDDEFRRDRDRAEALRAERAARAQAFFAAHAAQWDDVRALYVDEREVEARMRGLVGDAPVDLLVDLGTGTGRILELFADVYRRGIGIDTNLQMLTYARARLENGTVPHAQVRQGDISNLALGDGVADLAVMHQVLHFLSEPQRAIEEAARVLRSGGRLLVVDFAAHQMDHLRDAYAHQRLGFTDEQITQWFPAAELTLTHRQSLPPAAKAGVEGLTVTVWLGERGAAPRPRRTGATQHVEFAG